MPLEFCYSSDRNYAVNPLAAYVKLQEWGKAFSAGVLDILEELLGDVSDT